MKQRRLIAGATTLLALAAFAAGFLLSPHFSSPPASALPPRAAVERLLASPLTDPSGREITLAHWSGRPLIINFWATWCPPCLAEMPVFFRLQEKHRNIQFIGIALDTRENVVDFAGKNPASYPLLLASAGATALMAELGNERSGLPFTVGIDAQGQVRHTRLGGLSEKEAERLIAALQ